MKNKNAKKIAIIIIIIIFICALGLIIHYINKPKKLKTVKNITIKVGEKVPNTKEYVSKKDAKKVEKITIAWKDIVIEDDRIYHVGKYLGIIKYNNNEYNINLTVIDKEKPKIEGVKNIEVTVNDKIDLFKDVKITDNSKDEIKQNIEGEYDLSKKGEYNLKYIIKDKSGNTTKADFKLIVKEKEIIKIENNDVPATTSKGYKIEKKNGAYYINGILVANKTYSLDSTYNPGGLLSVFTINSNNMINDAQKEGISLKIISGFRSYATQKTLYNNYVNRDGQAAADRYSARAGHSEHQTGLAADINSLEQSWENTKEGKWLNENCYKYGFIIRYPKGKEAITGYMFEPWHIRYVGVELAKNLYNNGNWLTLEEYLGIDSKY